MLTVKKNHSGFSYYYWNSLAALQAQHAAWLLSSLSRAMTRQPSIPEQARGVLGADPCTRTESKARLLGSG